MTFIIFATSQWQNLSKAKLPNKCSGFFLNIWRKTEVKIVNDGQVGCFRCTVSGAGKWIRYLGRFSFDLFAYMQYGPCMVWWLTFVVCPFFFCACADACIGLIHTYVLAYRIIWPALILRVFSVHCSMSISSSLNWKTLFFRIFFARNEELVRNIHVGSAFSSSFSVCLCLLMWSLISGFDF